MGLQNGLTALSSENGVPHTRKNKKLNSTWPETISYNINVFVSQSALRVCSFGELSASITREKKGHEIGNLSSIKQPTSGGHTFVWQG